MAQYGSSVKQKPHIKQIMLSNIQVNHFYLFVGWQTEAPFILTLLFDEF